MRKKRPASLPRRSVFRRVVRIFLKVVLTVLIILVIVIILIQTPYIQNIVRGKAEKYLSRKLQTPVRVGYMYIQFPTSVTLKDIYVGDRRQDTLLSAGLVAVRLRMWGLLHNELDIREVQLSDLTARLTRGLPDSTFNFQFIVDAFTSKEPSPPATRPSTPMKLSLKELRLDKIRLVYQDSVTGNDLVTSIGHSVTRMDAIDLDSLHFTGKIGLDNSTVEFHNTPGALHTQVSIGHLYAGLKQIDLRHNIIYLDELQLDSSTTALRMGKVPAATRTAKTSGPSAKPGGPASTADSSAPWRFAAATIRLNGNNLQFDDDNQPRQPKGMDYAHIKAQNLTLHAASLSYSPDTLSGTITRGSMAEQSGLRLLRLQTRFLYTNHETWLKDLTLQTPGTLLRRSAAIKYTSLTGMLKDPAHTTVDVDLADSKVQLKDLLLFAPMLRSQPVFSHPNDVWLLNARLTGNLDALQVKTFQFSGIQDIRADLTGTIRHPLDARRINADLTVRNLSGNRAALLALLPKGSLPSNIAIPQQFSLKGRLAGGMDNMQPDLVLTTSSGNIVIKGYIRQLRQPKQAEYDLALQTRALDLGYLLKDSAQFGPITSAFSAKGKGLDLPGANATFNGHIDAATLGRYTYHNLTLDGGIANQQVTLHSRIDDPSVRFELQATGDLSRKFPALTLDWKIDTVDLLALHLMKDTMQFRGHIVADLTNTNPDTLQGNLKIADLAFTRGTQHYRTDSLILLAENDAGRQHLQFHSEMADLDWSGRYKITEVGTALQHTINQYYHLSGPTRTDASSTRTDASSIRTDVSSTRTDAGPTATSTGPRDTAFTPQDWQLQLRARTSPLVLTLMPSLKGTDSLYALIVFNSDRNDLHLDLKDPRIHVAGQDFQQVNLSAATGEGQLKYALLINSGTGSGFELHKTSLSGSLHDNHLFTDLLLKDGKDKNRYRLAGQLDKLPDGLKFMLNPDSLLLNYDSWQVSKDNFIQYDSSGVFAHNFTISRQNESLVVNSNPAAATSPLDVSFKNFRVNTLSRFASQDSLGVDGIIDGKVQVKNVTSNPTFTSDLRIAQLSYKNDTIGDLAVKVNNEKANAFAADLSLEGHGNDIKIKGEYYTGQSRMSMNADLAKVDLKTFSHVTESNVQSMSGYLRGQLSLTGNLDTPVLRGNLHFDSARIVPMVTGEPLLLSRDRIEFDADGFNFAQFALQDSAGNKLTVDGNVYTKNYRDYRFDVFVNAHNFRLVNAPEENNRQFYGKLNLDAVASLVGPMDDLKVDGDIRVNKQTNFYFVLPGSDPEIVNRTGVVRFVDRYHPIDTAARNAAILKAKTAQIKGLEVGMNIQTDSSAFFTMVIDERTGDALAVRGRSNLVFDMDKNGKMSLTGSYEVESGSYNLSLDVLKRKFAIQHGSTITWTGDPMMAVLDVTATYSANTPSLDLIANEVAGRTQTELNKFKQKLPFLVTLKMEGQLLKPKITFDITLPTNILALWPDVDQKLQQIRVQESELNKQVFALLLLNRFVGDDPLQSAAGGGSTLGNMAFQSASQILTNQLDQLAASLIKGVDIHFDLNNEQDFSTGTENDYTELNVSVSKRLFNDRIQVSVGSNFDVAGTSNPGQSTSNIAGDLAVDYRLTKDGRYMLRAYRKNQYQAVVEGQVVETGVSFILTFDYDKFLEIFGKTREEKLQERRRKATQPAGTGTPAGTPTTPSK